MATGGPYRTCASNSRRRCSTVANCPRVCDHLQDLAVQPIMGPRNHANVEVLLKSRGPSTKAANCQKSRSAGLPLQGFCIQEGNDHDGPT
eukprot:7407917-Heterocapsa_arctica.AAC.1